jgi:predicted acyltransferase
MSSSRIASIDIFRGLTMFLMIFVNDFWTLEGVPKWLEHAGAKEDFLGFSDVIFPAFLFIVGMSIPLAIRSRKSKGESNLKILQHIVLRSAILVVMGIFTVNQSEMNAEATGLSYNLFSILMVVGFFLAWNVYPSAEGWKKKLFQILQLAGYLLLAFLALKFRGNTDEAGHLHGMQKSWWGILGLIGWTYLVCAGLYLFLGKTKLNRILLFVFFLFLFIAHHAGLFDILGFNPADLFPGNCAFQVFTLGGMLLASHLEVNAGERIPKMIGMPVIVAALFILAGFLTRHFWIISKIQATPPWVFICTGISILVFLLLWFLVDKKGKKKWSGWLAPAGTNTLSCYVLPYLAYALAGILSLLLPLQLPLLLRSGAVGLGKSLFFSLFIIGLSWLLARVGVKLKI